MTLAWNYDLKAAPKNTPLILLFALRMLDDDNMPTGAIVGWTLFMGERDGEDIGESSDWTVPELDHMPGADWFGDVWEHADVPTAWCAPPDLPPVPESATTEEAPERAPETVEG